MTNDERMTPCELALRELIAYGSLVRSDRASQLLTLSEARHLIDLGDATERARELFAACTACEEYLPRRLFENVTDPERLCPTCAEAEAKR